MTEKARARKLKPEEMQGGTFTITNYGSIGGKYSTPILNVGESGILGVGQIFESLEMKNGKISAVKKIPISLTFDHQLIDGAQAARFIKTIRSYLEEPRNLLTEKD